MWDPLLGNFQRASPTSDLEHALALSCKRPKHPYIYAGTVPLVGILVLVGSIVRAPSVWHSGLVLGTLLA